MHLNVPVTCIYGHVSCWYFLAFLQIVMSVVKELGHDVICEVVGQEH